LTTAALGFTLKETKGKSLQAFIALWNLIKAHVIKFIIAFIIGGTITVLGMVPGTENVSNILGQQITTIKSSLGTTSSPTIVQ
jgi:hypothetical protein